MLVTSILAPSPTPLPQNNPPSEDNSSDSVESSSEAQNGSSSEASPSNEQAVTSSEGSSKSTAQTGSDGAAKQSSDVSSANSAKSNEALVVANAETGSVKVSEAEVRAQAVANLEKTEIKTSGYMEDLFGSVASTDLFQASGPEPVAPRTVLDDAIKAYDTIRDYEPTQPETTADA